MTRSPRPEFGKWLGELIEKAAAFAPDDDASGRRSYVLGYLIGSTGLPENERSRLFQLIARPGEDAAWIAAGGGCIGCGAILHVGHRGLYCTPACETARRKEVA